MWAAYICGWLFFVAISRIANANLQFVLNKANTHDVIIDGEPWVKGYSTSFRLNGRLYSSGDGSLKLKNNTIGVGYDAIGMFSSKTQLYSAGNIELSTTVRLYSDKNMAIFSQDFPDGAELTSSDNSGGVISSFPAFEIIEREETLGVLAYGGVFSGYASLTMTRWTKGMKRLPDGLNSGPVVLFDTSDRAFVISPFNHFTAASYSHDNTNNTISWGIMGNVDSVPKGYSMQTILLLGNKGINAAMEEWGEVMRNYYGRSDASAQSDATLDYLGYYTDNGAYYYGKFEPNKTAEQTLMDINQDAIDRKIPYKYLQLDDWWYPIENSHSTYGAALLWEAIPSILPGGLRNLYDTLKLPVIAHNRFWSHKTPYAKANGGPWDFLLDSTAGMSIPQSQEFWDWLFCRAKEWGFVTFEQDFLSTQTSQFKALHTNITLAETWLNQMGAAAFRYNMKIQYCMALPRHILFSLEVPAVSQARASKDYINKDQWMIGVTSIFLHALRITPSKDVFWTSAVQPGNIWGLVEVNPVREALAALLSTGPVGVGDKYKLTNTSITRRLSRSDGLLLKPGRPMTAINSQIQQAALGGSIGPVGEVYTSVYSLFGLQYAVVFASKLSTPYKLTPKDAGIDIESHGLWAAYGMDSHKSPVEFSSALPIMLDNCHNTSCCVYYVSPIVKLSWTDDFVLLGELDKYVPLSPQRLAGIQYGSSNVIVQLKGAEQEVVTLYYYANKKVVGIECVIGLTRRATVDISRKRCYSN